MIDKWQVVARNVAICEKCNGSMALWYNRENEVYCIFCDYCDNERKIDIEEQNDD